MKDSLEALLENVVTVTSNTITIKEDSQKATVKACTFEASGLDFVDVTQLAAKLNKPFKKNIGGLSFMQNCDGVFFVVMEGRYHLVLVELKSTLAPNTMAEAKEQLEVSFSKTMLLLQSMECFDPEQWDYSCFIVGKVSTEFKTNYEKIYRSGSKDPVVRFFLRMCSNVVEDTPGIYYSKLNKVLPFKPELKMDRLPRCIQIPAADSSISLDLVAELKR